MLPDVIGDHVVLLQCSVGSVGGRVDGSVPLEDGSLYAATTCVVRAVMEMTKAIQQNVDPSEYVQYVVVVDPSLPGHAGKLHRPDSPSISH